MEGEEIDKILTLIKKTGSHRIMEETTISHYSLKSQTKWQ